MRIDQGYSQIEIRDSVSCRINKTKFIPKGIEAKVQNNNEIKVSRKIPREATFTSLTSCPNLRAGKGGPTGAGWGRRGKFVTKGTV